MSTATIRLRGVTWNHSRGYTPLIATAQRFSEINPDVEITWEKRSLQAFGDSPVAEVTGAYDLMVIDHPHIGQAVDSGLLVALDAHLGSNFLQDQANHSVGVSHASYAWAGHQWALAIDAACPVMAWREDLLEAAELEIPKTWTELMKLARAGRVEIPSIPLNAVMQFFAIGVSLGAQPGANREQLIDSRTGTDALELLRELMSHCDAGCFSRDPIRSLDLLATSDRRGPAICLFPFGYSNYSRRGYAAHRLKFGEPPMAPNGQPIVTVLGGTGLALSARSAQRDTALRYASYVASPECQRGLYTEVGGQPGHRSAWLDEQNNSLTLDYFKRTLPALDRGWLRPRHAGYPRFQEDAGPVVYAALRGTLKPAAALTQLDTLWRVSIPN